RDFPAGPAWTGSASSTRRGRRSARTARVWVSVAPRAASVSRARCVTRLGASAVRPVPDRRAGDMAVSGRGTASILRRYASSRSMTCAAAERGSAYSRAAGAGGATREHGPEIRQSGAEGSRTLDLLNAIQALSQLSYGPTGRKNPSGVTHI